MNIVTIVLFILAVHRSDCVLQPSCSKVEDDQKTIFKNEYSTLDKQNGILMPEGQYYFLSSACVKPLPNMYYTTIRQSCSSRELPYGIVSDEEFEKRVKSDLEDTGYMDNYDLRSKNLTCPSLIEISNQGSCDSCWAVAATDVMTDRLCLISNGAITTRYSVMDLLSCCKSCLNPGGDKTKPCKRGGFQRVAWLYWTDTGIVSGHYNKEGRTGCRNYHVQPCTHDLTRGRDEKTNVTDADVTKCSVPTMSCPSIKDEDQPTCHLNEQECDEAWTGRSYKEDKMKGKTCYSMTRKYDGREAEIKLEILLNGPVHAVMSVYEDFYTMFTPNNENFHEVEPYIKDEKHEHGYGSCNAHSIRIVGWGKKNNKSYWIAANSWGDKWGDRGFFHLDFNHDITVKKGKETVYAGIPELI